jgi:DNA-binding response OmpR family regulator/Flp pilus assembly protein TadD
MTPDFASMQFLIIDDMEASRSTLRLTLSTFGVTHTNFAINGTDAMRRLANQKFDVILCDYVLGDGKDGQQVLEEIRHRNLISRSTVFIMITAERGYQKVINAVELAPDDYLIKPFNGETLRLRLERSIEKKGHFKAVYEFVDSEDFAAAIEECDRNIQAQSRHIIDFIRLKAELLLLTGNPDEARKLYETVLSSRAVPWAKMGLGKALLEQGQLVEAEELFLSLAEENDSYVAVYDCLAKTYEAMGDTAKAQGAIARAVEISPNRVVRQKKLGEIAFANEDHDTAEKAFRSSIELGKYSVHKSSDDHVGLSRALLGKGDHDKALEAMRILGNEYPDDACAAIQSAMTKSLIYKDMGNETYAKTLFDEAQQLFKSSKSELPGHAVVAMAETCLHFGQEQAANDIVRELATASHGDEKLLSKVSAVYKNFGMEEQAQRVIKEGNKDAVQLNNQAVMLAREGKLEEAIALLRQAADNKSAGITVILNAAQVIILSIDQNGWNESSGDTARSYLRRARAMDAANPKYKKVAELYKGITVKYGVRHAL